MKAVPLMRTMKTPLLTPEDQVQEAHMRIRGGSLQTSMCVHLFTGAGGTCSGITCTAEMQAAKQQQLE